jgi:membrane-bound lytic murein transglycosylase B
VLTSLLVSCSVLGAIDAGSVDAGVADAGVDFSASAPGSWRLSAKLAPGGPLRAALVADFTSPRPDAGPGEVPLTAAEAEAILDDPRAERIYGEKTVSIIAPSMITRQRKDHLDLMKLFLAPERLKAGAEFAVAREQTLAAVEAKTKVDREVIIGILMWESRLGTITGDYFAFNAFTSQAFFVEEASAVALSQTAEKRLLDDAAQKKRVATVRERARRNLVVLVKQCKGRGIDVLGVKGSWAGAIGFPQFMPASLRWADDGNGDGKIDLFDLDDSIASIGRYLKENGYGKSPRAAVWDYNHEEAYVEGVLAFAAALKQERGADAGTAGQAAGAKP